MSELTKDEKKELRKQEWQEELKKQEKKKKFKKIFTWLALPIVIVGSFWLITVITTPQSTTTASDTIKLPPVTNNDMTLGPKDAKIKLIEYADFQCPGCRSFHSVVKKLEKDYEGKILFVYRFFPLPTIHRNAYAGAQAAYAASLQAKFWEMHDLLFDNQDKWAELSDPTDIFVTYAQQLNLDVDTFKKDIADQKTKKVIQDSENKATNIGLNHTPSVFINGKEVDDITTYGGITSFINQQLAKK